MTQKKQNRPEKTEKTAYRPHALAAPIGGVFVALAVIGFLAVVYMCFRFTMYVMDDSKEKTAFERALLPVVMFDPAPFEQATEVDSIVLLRSSLWSALTSENASAFQYDDIGRLIVPQSDVDLQCARLFGTEVQLQHQSFYDSVVLAYVYDPQSKSYYVPTEGDVHFYTPSVERVVKNGDLFTLTVGYMPPLNAFTQLTAEDGWRTQPEKYMIYEMLQVEDHYQLLSIRYATDTTEQGATEVPGVQPTA